MMRNYLQVYRNYHKLPGKISFIQDILDQKKLFHRSPYVFLDQMNQISLDYRSIPLDFISYLFEADEKELSAKKFNSNLLHVTEWLILNSISIGMQKFLLALELREKALARALEYADSNNPLKWFRIDQIIGALIETEQLVSLKKHLKIAKLLRTGCGRLKFCDKLLSLIDHNLPDLNSGIESEYQEFIMGKGIAIVGPLTLSERENEEVKKKDIVITLNDYSLFKGRSYPEIQPDIIFYTGELQNPLRDKTTESEFQYVPNFIVYKKDKDYSPFLKNRTRLRDDINLFTFSGALNMVPRIILDVLIHGGKDIKVFGTDLYTSLDFSTSYNGEPLDNWNEVFEQFIGHDLITNYKFMHSLWSKGFYQADDRLERVMEMGLEGYLEYFEKQSFAKNN